VRLGVSLVAVFAFASTAAPKPHHTSSPEDLQFRRWLGPHLQAEYRDLPSYASPKSVKYGYALVDLNGDGTKEALAYVVGGMCGTGGCGLEVLRRDSRGWRIVRKTSIGYAPIQVLATRTHGWRDLGVLARIDAFERYEARLRFNGKTYPYNPTVPPAERMSKRQGGQVVIADATIPLFP
jgi:hypothetical protein